MSYYYIKSGIQTMNVSATDPGQPPRDEEIHSLETENVFDIFVIHSFIDDSLTTTSYRELVC